MKVAVSSSSFATVLRRGDLTHLEWLEGCASRLDLDGAVFARADFPRTDPEYAAQIKKVATDLGLVPVALEAPGLLDPDGDEADRLGAVALAAGIGAAILRVTSGPPGDLPPQTFARTVATVKALCKAAKSANVTLVVAAAPATLIASVTNAKHLTKDVDSAWLRYDVALGDPERPLLGPRDRVLVEHVPFAAAVSALDVGRGWLVLEGDAGDDPFGALGAAVRTVRAAEARLRLAALPA
jgi:sugar phosphate isomerase/epimerase